MASDRLFEMLANAKSQPSHAYRTAMTGIGALEAPIQGYMQTKSVMTNMAEQRAKLFDNYSKLAEAVGSDRALQLMGPTLKQADVNVSDVQPTGQGQSLEALQAQFKANPMSLPLHVRNMLSTLENAQANTAVRQQIANALSSRVGTMQSGLLPSRSGPNTAPGAAYQVKVAARQGKSIIAKATTPQNLSLASNDLARAVQRSAPYATTIGEANYASALPTLFSQFQQRLTADPNGPDVPKLRKQLYDTFNELDKAATPWISNELSNMEANRTNSTYGANWEGVKRRELGLDTPDIPFVDSSANVAGMGGKPRTVKQGNFTYTLNDQTGQYE